MTNPYLGLRQTALGSHRDELGLVVDDPSKPWGVVMEIGFDNGTATIVSFGDGNASLYWSSGGGSIGGYRHASVRDAARACVAAAAAVTGEMRRASDLPLPEDGQIIFYVRTDEGVLAASAPEDDLVEGHPLYPLFFAANAVVTAYREIEQADRAS